MAGFCVSKRIPRKGIAIEKENRAKIAAKTLKKTFRNACFQ
jgi:hypothetical protein